MYFKISKGTETYDKLMELRAKMDSAMKQAKKFVKTIKGAGQHYKNQHGIAGGIGAIEFKEKPEGWKSVGSSWQGLYMPKASEKKLWGQIRNLPVIHSQDVNEIVGFEDMQVVGFDQGIMLVHTPAITWKKDYILMSIARGCKFTPNKDMEEIVASVYDKLMEASSKKTKDQPA